LQAIASASFPEEERLKQASLLAMVMCKWKIFNITPVRSIFLNVAVFCMLDGSIGEPTTGRSHPLPLQ